MVAAIICLRSGVRDVMKWLATDPDADAILDFWEAYDQIDPLTLGTWHQTAELGDKIEGLKVLQSFEAGVKYAQPPKRVMLPEQAIEHLDAAKEAIKKHDPTLQDKQAQARSIIERSRR